MEKDFEKPKASLEPKSGFENWYDPPHPKSDIKSTPKTNQKGGVNGGSKGTFRIQYETQVAEIKKEIGNIETVRKKLNLSRRRMCQLLMVDPSAWTRWTKPGQDAPPHIYRALQRLLALENQSNSKNSEAHLRTYLLESRVGEERARVDQMEDKITELHKVWAIENKRQMRKWLTSILWVNITLWVLALAFFA